MLKSIELPELTTGKINIFLIQDCVRSQELLNEYYAELTHEEKVKYSKYHFEKDKKLYLLSRVLVKYTLANYLNCRPVDLEFELNQYGKPELKNSPVKFNLSHSGGVAAVAIGGSTEPTEELAIGIDVESIVAHKDIVDIAFNYFSPSECDILRATDEALQKEMFYQFWTLKETYIKAIGKGLSIDLNSFGFSFNKQTISVDHFGNQIEDTKTWSFMQARIYEQHLLALAVRRNLYVGAPENYQSAVYQFYPGVACESMVPENIQYSGK